MGARDPVRSVRPPATSTAELALTGGLARPVRLTVAELLAWPQHRAQVSFDCKTSGVRRHSFSGPLLLDVLAAAGPSFDDSLRKDRLRFLIAVRGRDGHHALLSWAEVDPDFGGAPVLLAVTSDGVPLDPAGPQLVLPQDRCGAPVRQRHRRDSRGRPLHRVDMSCRPDATDARPGPRAGC